MKCIIFLLFTLNFYFSSADSAVSFAKQIEAVLKNSNGNLSSLCQTHMDIYRRSLLSGYLKNVWALKMLDASAKIPSGILQGNIIDLGSFDECINIETEVIENNTIYGKYCIGTMTMGLKGFEIQDYDKSLALVNNPLCQSNLTRTMPSGGQLQIQLAKCLPHGCSAADMNQIYSYLGLEFNEKFCQTNFSPLRLDGAARATISFFGVILWFMIVSTIYDIVLYCLEKKPYHSIFVAFSVFTNGKKILETSHSSGQITCLHGIRVLSTMWVIIGHRYMAQSIFPMWNSADAAEWMSDKANMFILGATVSVDTFLVMAGMVISYVYMVSTTKGIKFNIALYYIHRYLRLTPVLGVVILIHTTLLKFMGSGPVWPQMIEPSLITACEKYWWKALLYIQNYGVPDYCIPQSWYLSVDFQLFILSPLLLFPLSRWPKYTLLGTGLLAVCSMVTCFLTAWFMEMKYSVVANLGDADKTSEFMKYYYAATQTRAASWFIGFVLGYVIFHVKQKRSGLVLNKPLIVLLWAISLGVLCTCAFAGHSLMFGKYDQVANSFHLALVRPAWALAVSFVIFACVLGYSGPVNWFLSLPLFQVVSKLTLTLYLSHFTMIYLITGQMRTAPRFSNGEMFYVFWGDFIFTIIVSLVLTLAFESPIITIEKIIFGGMTQKAPTPPLNQEDGRNRREIA